MRAGEPNAELFGAAPRCEQELQDAALAAAMIAEEEAEHDEAVRVRELFENRRLGTGNFSKLSVSVREKRHTPTPHEAPAPVPPPL